VCLQAGVMHGGEVATGNGTGPTKRPLEDAEGEGGGGAAKRTKLFHEVTLLLPVDAVGLVIGKVGPGPCVKSACRGSRHGPG
jgi:hypothetical protein